MPSPAPGPIGLDSKSGNAKQSSPSMAERIVNYARQRRGDRVGDGECFAFADTALRNAGARSASAYGSIAPDDDYVWGTPVTLADLSPGDIIQLRDYRYDRETVTDTGSETITDTDFGERPHHTAVVEAVNGGDVTVLEQNAPKGSPVTRRHLFFTSGTTRSGNTTTTIRLQGTWWFYRPQPR
jgi:hypothetical protein